MQSTTTSLDVLLKTRVSTITSAVLNAELDKAMTQALEKMV